MTEYRKGFLSGVAVVIIAIAFVMAFINAMDSLELMDCYKWQEYERDFPQYETATDTAKRCNDIGVNVYKYID